VVDATGQTGLISRKLGLRTIDPKLRHAALYTRYRGARRDSGDDEGATLIMQTRADKSWFWFIPLPDDLVSVGGVCPIDYLLKGSGSPQAVYDEELELCPAMQERLAQAERVCEIRPIRDFSYISKRIAGEGWVMAGDAFGFLDPIYSTGVFLALKSAELAADSVIEAFCKRDFSAARLGRHGEEYVAGMEAMRKLVYAYYDPGFSVPRFLKANPQYREQVVNLLVGNVFRVSVDGLFEAMGREIDLPESRSLAVAEEPS
jgi:flavin-dependent dehydrogenase